MSHSPLARLALRRFSSIAAAVAAGMNRGLLRDRDRHGLLDLEWRLLGDCIEVRGPGQRSWQPLTPALQQRALPGGVLALRVGSALAHEDDGDAERPGSAPRGRQRWIILALNPKPPLLH